MGNTVLTVPKTAKAGDIITVKALIHHPMEAGLRRDAEGRAIPRLIVNRVVCRYNGKVVFEADWHANVAADPYLAFDLRAKESGLIELLWTDDSGRSFHDQALIIVS